MAAGPIAPDPMQAMDYSPLGFLYDADLNPTRLGHVFELSTGIAQIATPQSFVSAAPNLFRALNAASSMFYAIPTLRAALREPARWTTWLSVAGLSLDFALSRIGRPQAGIFVASPAPSRVAT